MSDGTPTIESASARRETLAAFSRALGREANVLAERPNLLWQQLYNRLQWEQDPTPTILMTERERRCAPGAAMWLRLRAPLLESSGLLRTLSGHVGEVTCCAVSPSGNLAASGGRAGSLILWNARTGQEILAVKAHSQPITACCFSPDGQTIATASRDNSLRVWDATSGELKAQLFEGVVATAGLLRRGRTSCVFSPDGTALLSGGDDDNLAGTLGLWDTRTWRRRGRLLVHAHAVTAVGYTPDGSTIVTASRDNLLKLWSADSGDEIGRLVGHTHEVLCCTTSSDGAHVASGGEDRRLILWDLHSRQPLQTAGPFRSAVRACAFSPDSSLLVASTQDGEMACWKVESWTEVRAPWGHTGRVTACAFFPSNDLLTAGTDGALKVWTRVGSGTPSKHMEHMRAVAAMAFSPDGRLLATGGAAQPIRIWEVASAQKRFSLTGPPSGVRRLAFAPGGTRLVTCPWDGSVGLWNVETGEHDGDFQGTIGWVLDCSFSPDGARVAAVDDGEQHEPLPTTEGVVVQTYRPSHPALRIWDAHTRTQTVAIYARMVQQVVPAFDGSGDYRYDTPWDTCSRCVFSPDGSLITDGWRVWSVATGERVWSVKTGEDKVRARLRHGLADISLPGCSCAFSPDGATLLTWDTSDPVALWDLKTGEGRTCILAPTVRASECAFSPDGRLVIMTCSDATIKVWDVLNGHVRGELPLPGAPGPLAVHPSQHLFAVCDQAGNLYFVDIEASALGPIVVTAQSSGEQLSITCPVCRQATSIDESTLGKVVACPRARCTSQMRVNSFVIHLIPNPDETVPAPAPQESVPPSVAAPPRRGWPFGKRR